MNRMILLLPYEQLVRLFANGTTIEVLDGIPADARILGFENDMKRQAVRLLVEHPSFPRSPEGGELLYKRVQLRTIEAPGEPLPDRPDRPAMSDLVRRQVWDGARWVEADVKFGSPAFGFSVPIGRVMSVEADGTSSIQLDPRD